MEVLRSILPALKAGFGSLAQARLETALLAGPRPVTGRDEDAVGHARMQVHVVIER